MYSFQNVQFYETNKIVLPQFTTLHKELACKKEIYGVLFTFIRVKRKFCFVITYFREERK